MLRIRSYLTRLELNLAVRWQPNPGGAMRGLSTVFALAFMELIVIGCNPKPEGLQGLTAQDSVALRKIAERDAPIVLSRDWDALAAEYAEDAVRMPPNSPAVQG